MAQTSLQICGACGIQYDTNPSNCKICDDPRQFVPRNGQTWTNLEQLRRDHHNEWKQDERDSRVWSVWTEPKFAIGQRAFFLETPKGNIMWDLISLLDDETVKFINSKGGLKAIVISHPHFYTTYVEWAQTFNCPVVISRDDADWLCRQPPSSRMIEYIDGPVGSDNEIVEGVKAVKLGGHFPGSLVLHWEKKLFIADTFVTVVSAYSPHPRPAGYTTFSFLWSVPNMIPLSVSVIQKMWEGISHYDFDTTHGGFAGMDIRDENLKRRLLESMKILVKAEGWEGHAFLNEKAE